MRQQRSFTIANPQRCKQALLAWARQYDPVVWLDSNGHTDTYGTFDALLALGQPQGATALHTLQALRHSIDHERDWLLGYFSYDLKNVLEALSSNNFDGLGFPALHFFRPRKLVLLQQQQLHFMYDTCCAQEIARDFAQLMAWSPMQQRVGEERSPIRLQARMPKADYLAKVQQLLHHIYRGNIYEANLCQEFYAEKATIAPWHTYAQLNALSQPPFAAFLRQKNHYLLCASPERYLQKKGQTVISQPIKGTAGRGTTPKEDAYLKTQLARDAKERAENIMITDLVRNDLSKSALRGSVRVQELCAVYTYPQLHQMISTVVAQVAQNKHPLELITETFPMGSMTGAPKIAAMKCIEEVETTQRGLYSGAVGYFTPRGDFDFNVVIRSILYNAATRYVSLSVGSAITAQSHPEREYQECLLKANALQKVLEAG